ncbi:hypothetical protein [Sphingopyxis alaskensis]|uniref:Uncharacterized protein n=2 Tax=Sphingopyxis alaskensis TaxID=117207 RepID=Q1GTK4_SPHAL|nr:hypothetical protein [Sphingopyxis alaskensis]ABF53018.1 hypothetical protein Sala_1304 [Sphingopyxis alaskensis RB2256]MCM3420094.1 hypothetical protein [Sphingopyxis alaskensis]
MKRQSAILCTVMSVYSLGSQMAYAQATGTYVGPSPAQIPDRAGISKEDRARIAMYRYAECVVDKSRARVEKYLETFPGSKTARDSADRLAVDACLSTGHMRFSETVFRSGVYDVFYRKQFQKDGPVDFSAVLPIDYSTGGEVQPDAVVQPHVSLRRISECAVRKAPQESRELILSMVASNAEASALDKIVPSVGSCVAEGNQLVFSRSALRGVIGEVLYRLSVAASQPTIAAKD